MSEVKVNKISPRTACGTVTLGDSGDTIALGCGASQTGFGRTGTVNWVTTKKTTGFTAVSGNGYFCDTAASGAFTLTLPTSPSAGDIVGMKDYNGNFATANLTIGRGGEPINGASVADVTISTAGAAIFLVYVDATQGWVATQDDSSTFAGETFIVATGGTITCSGDDKIHTFTGPGTFTVCSIGTAAADNLISYVIVAGGGSGGTYVSGSPSSAGGGGAGGFRETKSPATPYTASPLDGYPTPGNRITVTATGYPITVGGGAPAAGPGAPVIGIKGSDSTALGLTSTGGGYGANGPSGPDKVGGPGGSGGGGGGGESAYAGGAGNTPPTTPSQGFPGGVAGCGPPQYGSGGGGGATEIGAAGIPTSGGRGGAGATTCISASPTAYAGGGGGSGGCLPAAPGAGSPCGTGGASSCAPTAATSGTENRGGGGGGHGSVVCTVSGAGGSGIVIIRYKYQ